MRRHRSLKAFITTTASCAGLALAFAIGAPTVAHAEYLGYPDLDAGHWAVSGGVVDWSEENDVIHGFPDGRWAPDEAVTRAQTATILWNYSGNPEPGGGPTFDDASTIGWATDAAAWAQDEGVFTGSINGDGTVTFDGDGLLTREQAAKVLCSFSGSEPSSQIDFSGFKDPESVSGWARGSVAWAVNAGVITGSVEEDGDYIRGQRPCTRAQFVAMLLRVMEGNGEEHKPSTDPGAGRQWVWVPEYAEVEKPVYEQKWVADTFEGWCYHCYCSRCGYGIYLPWDHMMADGGLSVAYPEEYELYKDVIWHVQHRDCGNDPIPMTEGEKVWHTIELGTGHYEQVQVGTKTEVVETGGHWEARTA